MSVSLVGFLTIGGRGVSVVTEGGFYLFIFYFIYFYFYFFYEGYNLLVARLIMVMVWWLGF